MNLELRFGQPTNYDFETILDQFSGTKINSFRTSSIPLVQFWKDTDKKLNELFDKLNLHADKVTLCFEYPTKPLIGVGKSSMTDLMILDQNLKIAIEAKFTEYKKMKADPIKKWKTLGDKANRVKVLEYWTSLIKPFTNGIDDKTIEKISYQFYHRTASACKINGKAVVVYQVFYDPDTIDSLDNYKQKLFEYVTMINPNENLKFYIWEIEVVQRIFDDKKIDPFIEMKFRNVYDFTKSKIIEL
jgi:hypothetical protein